MDELTAIYLQFSKVSDDVEEDIRYYVGSESRPTAMRQLIPFACRQTLELTRKIKLANFNTLAPLASAVVLPYAPVVNNAVNISRPISRS